MSRYIEAEKLERDGWYAARTYQQDAQTRVYETRKMTELPTADVRENVHGKWLWLDGVRCSKCNHKLQTTGLPSFCPNCGAKMDERRDDG